MQLPWT